MNDLVILVPVLGRTHHIEPLLESISESTPAARVLFLATEGDDDMICLLRKLDQQVQVLLPNAKGDYARKINHGYRNTVEPLIFLAASDLRFHPGWFEAASALLTDQIRVVGTNDLGNRRTAVGHSTHSLVARDYADRGTIDEPRKILHEGYVHEWCDDELVGTAKKRKAYAHAPDAVVEHLHPSWGKGETDANYQNQRSRMRASAGLYRMRSRKWT